MRTRRHAILQERYETEMNFFAVFSFFSENVELTPQQRFLELVCVSVLAVLLLAGTAYVLYRKIKDLKAKQAAQTAETESGYDGREKQ